MGDIIFLKYSNYSLRSYYTATTKLGTPFLLFGDYLRLESCYPIIIVNRERTSLLSLVLTFIRLTCTYQAWTELSMFVSFCQLLNCKTINHRGLNKMTRAVAPRIKINFCCGLESWSQQKNAGSQLDPHYACVALLVLMFKAFLRLLWTARPRWFLVQITINNEQKTHLFYL